MCEFGWSRLGPEDKALILHGIETAEALTLPRAAQVDWSDRCNSKCFYCTQRHVRRDDELDLPVLERLFAECDALGVKALQVAGGGEPLFHREIPSVLDAVARRGFTISTLVTNGVLLSGDIARRLLDLVSHRILVSLNSYGEEEWERMSGTPRRAYRAALDNLRQLASWKRLRAKPILTVQFLVHDGNAPFLRDMLDLAVDLGADEVVFNPIHIYDQWSQGILKQKARFLDGVRDLYQADRTRIVADVQTLFSDLNREIVLLREREFSGSYPEVVGRHRRYWGLNAGCPLPWYFSHVKATGDVYPCCFLLSHEGPPMGSIRKGSVRDVWNNDRFRAFRRAMTVLNLGGRAGQNPPSKAPPLPALCTTPGKCIIRHLPYLDDGPFYVDMDALTRGPAGEGIRFPPALRHGLNAVVDGRIPGPPARGGIEVRINYCHAGNARCTEDRFEFTFSPDPLPTGYHLLEVIGSDGTCLAARMIEKP